MTNGTVTIGTFSTTLPEQEARTLFLAAGKALRLGTPLAVDPHTMIAITPGVPIVLSIQDGFTDEFNPAAYLERASRRKPRSPVIL